MFPFFWVKKATKFVKNSSFVYWSNLEDGKYQVWAISKLLQFSSHYMLLKSILIYQFPIMLFFLPSSNCAYHGEEYSLKVWMDEPAFSFGRNFTKMQKNRNKWIILSEYFRFSGKNLQFCFFLNLKTSHHVLVW